VNGIQSSYDFKTDGFQVTLDLSPPGALFVFESRAVNSVGHSEFSNSLTVALGPLPSQCHDLTIDTTKSSATSIFVEWQAITSDTLPILHYSLYQDDGFGVTFNKVYQGDCTEYLA
jgi:hypothetical protein